MCVRLFRLLMCFTILLVSISRGPAHALDYVSYLHVPAQYPTIQSAIDAAVSGHAIVIVADGTYTGTGNVDLDFNGKSISLTSEHGAAQTIIDCQGTSATPHRGFIFHSGETSLANVDGFTVKNGYEASEFGGGLALLNSSPTISRCILTGNTALVGGGMSVKGMSADGGSPRISNCNFISNTAVDDNGSSFGGGLYSESSSPVIVNSNFDSNVVITHGDSHGGSSGYAYGGGLSIFDGSPIISNCTFIANTATGTTDYGGVGGGLEFSYSNLTIINCTFSSNSANGFFAFGGGIAVGGNSSTTAANCILWGNNSNGSSSEVVPYNTPGSFSLTITSSDIQDGYFGTGNINADPLFVNAAAGNLHLQSGSPCLGTGTPDGAPTTDLDGNTRPNPPSMGAYELVVPATIMGFTLSPAQLDAPGPNVTADVAVSGAFSKVTVSCAPGILSTASPTFTLTNSGGHWTGSFPTAFLNLAKSNPVTFVATGTRADATTASAMAMLSVRQKPQNLPNLNLYLSPVSKTVGPDQIVTFSVIVSNITQTDTLAALVTVTLPDNMEFISSRDLQYDNKNTLTWTGRLSALPSVGTLSLQNVAILSFTARVKADAIQGARVPIKAVASSFGFQDAEADVLLTVGGGIVPDAVRIDASQGLGILDGDSAVDLGLGNTPLHAVITPKTTMPNWITIFGDTRPLSLWLEISVQHSSGANYAVSDNLTARLLDQEKLLNPSADLSYDATFTTVGDSVSVTATFGPKAALFTTADVLIQIFDLKRKAGLPTIDQVTGFAHDLSTLSTIGKVIKDLTDPKPVGMTQYRQAIAKAFYDLASLKVAKSEQNALSDIIRRRFNVTLSVKELQDGIGVFDNVNNLVHFYYDLIAFNLMTKGNPMTVSFVASVQ